MIVMAIVKASYTKSSGGAKAYIRYIEHRKGKDNAKITRTLWGIDGKMERTEAYHMIDEAEKGNVFYRLVISPDPQKEDTEKDLFLREITHQTMLCLEDRFQTPLQWIATEHNDHTPHRHVHLLAVIPGKLNVQDFQQLRKTATEAALLQRQERDQLTELHKGKEEEQWQQGS